MDEHCKGCIRYLKGCSGLSKELCEKHKLRTPRTNADRIRAMTDDELAQWLAIEKSCSWNDGFYGIEGTSENDLLSWLKSPVEVDG